MYAIRSYYVDYTAIESGNVVINKDEISLTELLHNVKARNNFV